MRKKDEGKRRFLLDCARRIECEEGMDAVNMRRLAFEADIAVGTVYNYFDSKQAVLFELTEEYWNNAFVEMQSKVTAEKFSDQLRQIHAFLIAQMNDCAEVLMQNLSGSGESARKKMAAVLETLKMILFERLERDDAVRMDVWNENFTCEAFSQFALSYLLALLRQKGGDIDTFIAVVERILYGYSK